MAVKLLSKITVEPQNGLNRTLNEMFKLQHISMNNPEFVAWVKNKFPVSCLACIPGKVWQYVIDNFTYRSDDPYDEIIRAPHILLEQKKGDCDDFSLFIKTCIDILGGFNSKYLLLAKEKNHYTHVLVFLNRGVIGGKYVDPVYVDGANSVFNQIAKKYKYFKLVG